MIVYNHNDNILMPRMVSLFYTVAKTLSIISRYA